VTVLRTKGGKTAPNWLVKPLVWSLNEPMGGSRMVELATDLTVREVARAAETVLGRSVQVTPETDIARDLAVDSLALMNIVMELEDRFDLSIPLDRLATVQTVGDLSELINKLRIRA
jgi:acyl carrier protein